MKKRGNLATWTVIALALAALVIWAATSRGQTPPPVQPPLAKYQPTEVQSLRLQVAQKNAQLAQAALQQAQRNFQDAFAALNAEAEKVKAEEHWDAKVTFDPDKLTFAEAAVAAAPAPAPAEAKKP